MSQDHDQNKPRASGAHDSQNWPRDFDIRASRAEQQELLNVTSNGHGKEPELFKHGHSKN